MRLFIPAQSLFVLLLISHVIITKVSPPFPSITFLDVGHGDSIVLRDQMGKAVLWDSGRKKHAKAIDNYLKGIGNYYLDSILLTHPDKDKYYIDENGHIKHISKKKYDLTYLNIFTEKRKLPNNHKLFTSLKNMFETGSFMEDDNFNLWLNFLKKTNYKGIDINQAIELSNISNNSGYQNVKDNYKIGHYICGLIIDWWKIRKNKISTVQCYYDLIRDDDPLPYFNTNIKCAALFDTKCNFKKFFHFDKHTFTETCPNYGKDIKNCKCEHNNRYYFCINNLF